MLQNMIHDLVLRPMKVETSCFSRHVNRKLIKITRSYGDDSLLSGTSNFLKHSGKTLRVIKSKKPEKYCFIFFGPNLTSGNGFFPSMNIPSSRRSRKFYQMQITIQSNP